jgi:plasmid stabilization system protein ParE
VAGNGPAAQNIAEFLRCLEACLDFIRRHPHAHRVAVDEFRRALIRRFLDELFYEPTDDTVIVLAVFHCSQKTDEVASTVETVG